jgi:anti-sigma factor RsiW
MSNTPDARTEALRPYLSALVDGELEPLEAVALQRHARQHPSLAREMADIEQLKLAVHVAGTRDAAPPGLETRLRASLDAAMAARREANAPRRAVWPLFIGGSIAALGAAVALAVTAQSPVTDPAVVPAVAAHTPLEASVLARLGPADGTHGARDGRAVVATLVDLHRGDLPEPALGVLREASLVVGWERVPVGFVEPMERDRQLVLASTMSCTERPGATLVMLKARHVDLPAHIDEAIETVGVYTERIDGVNVRYSRGGDTLLLVLEGDDRFSALDPI